MEELTKEQLERLKEICAELRAIEGSLPIDDQALIDDQIVLGYHDLIQSLDKINWENVSSRFMVSPRSYPPQKGRNSYYLAQPFKIALRRLIAYLKEKYNVEEDKIVGIGNIIQIIRDEQLRNRCMDLLSAKGNFDRVIREATTILEDRIRTLADPTLREVGVKLVDKVLNLHQGVLILDGELNEQEGFYQLYRGVMLSLRDETHHKIIDRFSREDALKTLAFIDILLETLKRSKRRE